MEVSDLRLIFSDLDGQAVRQNLPHIIDSISAIHRNASVAWQEIGNTLDIRIDDLYADAESTERIEDEIAAIVAPYSKPAAMPVRLCQDAAELEDGMRIYGLRYDDLVAHYAQIVSDLTRIDAHARFYIDKEEGGVCCVYICCGPAGMSPAVEALADAIMKEYWAS